MYRFVEQIMRIDCAAIAHLSSIRHVKHAPDANKRLTAMSESIFGRGHWKGTPVAIKKWFDPNMSDELMQEFRSVLHQPVSTGLTMHVTWHALLMPQAL